MATAKQRLARPKPERSKRLPCPAGRYAFHFSGFTRVSSNKADTDGIPYYIVGTGHIAFLEQGKVSGRQTSTVMAMSGAGPTQKCSIFELKGTCLARADRTGSMTLYFHRVTHAHTPQEAITSQPEMTDTFEFISFDRGKRLRFMSTRPTMLPEKELVDELVSAEAVQL